MIHTISLSKKQIVTEDNIIKAVTDARTSYDYVKYTFYNSMYIAVSFNRDNTILISTNSRDILLCTEIQRLTNSYTQALLISYLFKWIQRYN